MATLGYIQVTRLCNQKCRICSNPEISATISFKDGISIIEDFLKRGYYGVIFTGGEPTLHPELPKFIEYAKIRGIHSRIITNAQKTSDFSYLKELVDCGLQHIHISIYSHIDEVQSFISQNRDSLKNILKSLENIAMIKITADINTAINHYNAHHLYDLVKFLVERFPFLNHFVWNNLDPTTNRVTQNPDVIPQLWEFEVSLNKAMNFLTSKGKTFRVERVPLCYITEFAEFSTETRKIVKEEERIVYFLDHRGMVQQTEWKYGKTDCCKVCTLDKICAGLYEMDKYYSAKELYPVFVSREKIIEKILNRNPA